MTMWKGGYVPENTIKKLTNFLFKSIILVKVKSLIFYKIG